MSMANRVWWRLTTPCKSSGRKCIRARRFANFRLMTPHVMPTLVASSRSVWESADWLRSESSSGTLLDELGGEPQRLVHSYPAKFLKATARTSGRPALAHRGTHHSDLVDRR